MLKIYKASAGSGKTYTLVKEYLKLCLPHPQKYKSIVAITFTNSAAAEMKNRVLQRLSDLSNGKDDGLKNNLLSEGLTLEQINNAPVVFENILRDYSRFNIGTIDSFFHKILRVFGKELGLPYEFEIFLKNDEALDHALETFLKRSISNPELHQLLMDFINEKVLSGRTWQIKQDLRNLAAQVLKDDTFNMDTPEINNIKEFINELRKIVSAFESEMDRLGKSALKAMEEAGFTLADFKNKERGPANYFNKIQIGQKKYVPGEMVKKVLDQPSEWLTKKSPGMMQLSNFTEQVFHKHLLSAQQLYKDKYRDYVSAIELLKTVYTFSVYGEIQKLITEYKNENELVLISDFNRILSNHLLKEQMDFIYSKIGARYEHFLIDEFQDTSGLQWMNLFPLIENAVSQGAECLLVGDAKQAIYRWRGGKVELISSQVSDNYFPGNSQKETLKNNFRSHTEIVAFNNDLFTKSLNLFPSHFHELELLHNIYADVKQIPAGKKEGISGRVELVFFEKEGNSKDAYISNACTRMVNTISQLFTEGMNMRDITILVRNNAEAEIVAETLNQYSIEFISPDSLFLDKSPHIRLILAALHYLVHPSNQLAKSELLYLYLNYVLKDSLIANAEIFNDVKNGDLLFKKHLPSNFLDHKSSIVNLPLYELIERILKDFNLFEKIDPYILSFRQVILEFTRNQKLSIHSFLEWWANESYTVVLNSEMNAIRIMTIHKSKGLEFPVVFIPFANWKFKSTFADLIWVSSEHSPFNSFAKLPISFTTQLEDSVFHEAYHKEDAMLSIDNVNLMYVAFTRPRNRLYIYTEKVKKVEELSNVSAILNKVFESQLHETNEIIFENNKPIYE